ncbi:hypothetical protein TWF569_011970 [Orbilia oligospora]|nr:hypothetical protein TWF706_012007 [Orbilia oligospora]KAF3131262.1 hypothetical protein TWF594_011890 [Orbilia oligospora]KAF3144369.1 hypothetical protein TWF569_011970 [Orbilia oligospora]
MRMPGTLAAKCSATVKFSGTGKAQLWLVKENTPRPGRTRKKPAERGQTADLGWMH